MKSRKYTKLIFGSLLASLSLTGCTFFNNLVNPGYPTPETLDPVSLRYTVKDLYSHSLYDIDNFPNQGETKLLVIPIYFSDSSLYVAEHKKEAVLNDIEKAFNGTSNEVGFESVSSYYSKLSNDKFNLTANVADWYVVNKPGTYYGLTSNEAYLESLYTEAIENYFSKNLSDRKTNYDYDKNGVLDGVAFIYAYPDYVSLQNQHLTNLWAYVGWMQRSLKPNVNDPVLNQYLWASYSFMYSKGNDAKERTGSTYGGGDTSHSTIDTHTYIHEFGHLLGLYDYYDYSDNAYVPAGMFSMQDLNVGSHDPYSALLLGWAQVIVPSESCTIEIKPFQDTKTVILLTNEYTGSVFDEYFLLELYTPTGLNAFDTRYKYLNKYPIGPSLPGIRLWHVDARLGRFTLESGQHYFHGLGNLIADGYMYDFAFTNSYNEDYGSVLHQVEGYEYALDCNQLQLIRDNTSSTYRPEANDGLTYDNMFVAGESFSMEKYSKQFINGTKLNSNKDFRWSFKVNLCTSEKASITFTLK